MRTGKLIITRAIVTEVMCSREKGVASYEIFISKRKQNKTISCKTHMLKFTFKIQPNVVWRMEQDRKYTYNVIMRCVRVTIIAIKNQYSERVFVDLVIQHAKRMHRVMSSVASTAL